MRAVSRNVSDNDATILGRLNINDIVSGRKNANIAKLGQLTEVFQRKAVFYSSAQSLRQQRAQRFATSAVRS